MAFLRAMHAASAALLVCACVLVLASTAHAQEPKASASTAAALRLNELRLQQHVERRREGFTLLAWGAANTAAGAVAAGVARRDDAWLAAGVTTLSFGAINALLSLGLTDFSGKGERAIVRERERGPSGFIELRERALIAQLKSGQGFALNAGLDVFYVASGALLMLLARHASRHSDWERGAGAAMIAQGGFLLGFDIACWVGTSRRAAALRALRAD